MWHQDKEELVITYHWYKELTSGQNPLPENHPGSDEGLASSMGGKCLSLPFNY